MRRFLIYASILACCLLPLSGAVPRFTLDQVLSAPFPTSLTAAPKGGAVAWVLDERGARNVWIATAPDYRGRRVTDYRDDDGQEIAELAWTPDGSALLFVRGGDFEMGRSDPNPASNPHGVEQAIWIVPVGGGPPRRITDGNSPTVSPKGDRFVFLHRGEIWSTGLSETDKPSQLIHANGSATQLSWSPDGARLAFVSGRRDHSFIGVYGIASQSLRYLDPSVDADSSPVWSPDSREVAFIRIAASTRAFSFGPVRTGEPWSLRVADAMTGAGRELWRASDGPGSVFHPLASDQTLFWATGDRLIFPWEKTGWSHLYALPVHGGAPAALNRDGEYEVENASVAPDRKSLLLSSNEGDIDRRHIWRLDLESGKISEITPGTGIEWSPVQTSTGALAILHSDATHAASAAIQTPGERLRELAPDSVPATFPANQLVTPEPVIITAADGMQIHGQLFLPASGQPGRRHPALIFFHGGSRRQMLLGFHYMDYYHNAYAMNEYLASLGYVVLAVNYRSGIGYGLNFREALNYGATGASEFNDVLGAGLYLKNRPDVDGQRIGLWGGSYGGYLTALGLARASDLFAAGVDFHGVHDWNGTISNFVPAYNPGKDADAARVAFESSPMASVNTWKSPVLLIHGDDDRNVPFHQTVMLVEALRQHHVPFEQLVFPDEIHGFLTYTRWLQAYTATADFLSKYLKP